MFQFAGPNLAQKYLDYLDADDADGVSWYYQDYLDLACERERTQHVLLFGLA